MTFFWCMYKHYSFILILLTNKQLENRTRFDMLQKLQIIWVEMFYNDIIDLKLIKWHFFNFLAS